MSDRLEKAFRAGEIGEREKEQAEDAREEIHILGRIAHDWHRLVDAAIKFFKTFEKSAGPTAVQIKGDSIMGFAILPGATGTFGLTLTTPTSVCRCLRLLPGQPTTAPTFPCPFLRRQRQRNLWGLSARLPHRPLQSPHRSTSALRWPSSIRSACSK